MRMLARVAREARATPPPRARGFLGKANPPRVSRGLRLRREPTPKDGRWTFLHRARPATRRRRRRGGAGFWTPPSPKGRRARGKSRAHEPVPGAKRISEARLGAVPEKPLSVIKARAPVPQTDAGGPVEHTEAIGRTVVKELGKTAP